MVKKNYKIVTAFILGIIISSIGVYAASLSSSEVTYDNKDTGIKAENLQGAIDELYTKTNEQKSKMPKPGNSNIVKVYFYNQEKESEDFCVTGDEATCKVNTCYLNTSKDSCVPGTIIEYKVKEGEEVRFHVVHDDGEIMTLQSQKNTVSQIAWYTSENNKNGPTTSLTALESATEGWANVNDQTYSIGDGSTKLGYSGCFLPTSCLTATYSLIDVSAKARMITLQEANKLGCTYDNQSCPIWMYNYLENSKTYGGTVNDSSSSNYWMMTTQANYTDRTWIIDTYGHPGYDLTSKLYAIRAVVEINK